MEVQHLHCCPDHLNALSLAPRCPAYGKSWDINQRNIIAIVKGKNNRTLTSLSRRIAINSSFTNCNGDGTLMAFPGLSNVHEAVILAPANLILFGNLWTFSISYF